MFSKLFGSCTPRKGSGKQGKKPKRKIPRSEGKTGTRKDATGDQGGGDGVEEVTVEISRINTHPASDKLQTDDPCLPVPVSHDTLDSHSAPHKLHTGDFQMPVSASIQDQVTLDGGSSLEEKTNLHHGLILAIHYQLTDSSLETLKAQLVVSKVIETEDSQKCHKGYEILNKLEKLGRIGIGMYDLLKTHFKSIDPKILEIINDFEDDINGIRKGCSSRWSSLWSGPDEPKHSPPPSTSSSCTENTGNIHDIQCKKLTVIQNFHAPPGEMVEPEKSSQSDIEVPLSAADADKPAEQAGPLEVVYAPTTCEENSPPTVGAAKKGDLRTLKTLCNVL